MKFFRRIKSSRRVGLGGSGILLGWVEMVGVGCFKLRLLQKLCLE